MKKKNNPSPADITQTFHYSPFMKFVYRYLNIPTTLLLLLYLLPVVLTYKGEAIQIFTVILLVIVIIVLNLFYWNFYTTIPYEIKTDENKITISKFMKNDRTEEIAYSSITNLSGGIFEGRISGLMKVHYGNSKHFGFFQRIKNAKFLEAILLSKVDKNIYDKVLDNLNITSKTIKK